MQRMPSRDEIQRPPAPSASRSFSRYEPQSSPAASGKDSDPPLTAGASLTESPTRVRETGHAPERSHSDVFETPDDPESEHQTEADADPEDASREDFESLPIEIRSLVER